MESTTNKFNKELLKLTNISLKFGNLTVLNNTNFSLNTHEIHALVGEHGAGKSSLAKIIAGFQEPRTGLLEYNGVRLNNHSPQLAKQKKIEMVTQNNPLFNQFTIANNIIIGKVPFPLGFINHNRDVRTTTAFFKKHNIPLDPLSVVGDLNLSDRVMVDFCKHIFDRPKLLILDETLEQLSNTQLQKVIPILQDFKARGSSILFITHRIDDIYKIADRVSIMREGNILVTEDVKNIDKINLIKLAYTQVIKEHSIKHLNIDFYNLLKYNEAILANLPFSLLVTDTKRNVRLINNAAKSYFEFNISTHSDISLKKLFGEENDNIYQLLRDRIVQQKEEHLFNISMKTESGLSSQNISIIPLFDGRHFIGNIITLENVTEYEKLRRQLLLSENLSSIGLLAAGVAHEINNPLEIINNYMQNLKLTNLRNKKIIKTVEDVEEEIISISNIIGNLLLFSENKKMEHEKVEINNLLLGIIRLLKKSAEHRDITLSFITEKDDIFISGIKTEFKQIFLNILKNSLEAIQNDGNIKIYTLVKDIGTDQSRIEILFTDDGPGIDKKIVDNIFMPFFSTKNSSAANMGLGLSITYNIVKKYGGDMTIENGDKAGCKTLLTFPFRPGIYHQEI